MLPIRGLLEIRAFAPLCFALLVVTEVGAHATAATTRVHDSSNATVEEVADERADEVRLDDGVEDGQDDEDGDENGNENGNENGDGDDDGERETPEPGPTVGQRVHIIVDRRTTVQGTIEFESGEVIVVRVRGEELKSLPKARVLRVVRLVEPGPRQTGVVHMSDGRLRRGVILEDGFEAVIVEIEGIRTVLPRDTVDFVELEPTFDERLQQFRDAIGPHDHTRRFELARWLVDERELELAREELLAILDRAEMPAARRLLMIVDARLALNTPIDADGPTRGQSSPRPSDFELPDGILTDADVNIIRVYEMDLNQPPRMTIGPDTIRRLVDEFATSDLIPTGAARNDLLRAEPVKIARLMFQLRARDLYPEISVLGDPAHLNLFRQRVHNAWLIPTCATSRCHGGPDAGPFFLHNRNHKDERVRYTNLLILDQMKLDGRALVDYEDPMMSLIIQAALPRHNARLPHPDVRGWRPMLTDGNRRVLDDTLRWIRSMHMPRPHYPVDFELPDVTRGRNELPERDRSTGGGGFTVPRGTDQGR